MIPYSLVNKSLIDLHNWSTYATHPSKKFDSNRPQSYIFFYETVNLVGVRYGCPKFDVVPLALVYLAGVGSDVLVRGAVPQRMETGLGFNYILVGDNVPGLYVVEK